MLDGKDLGAQARAHGNLDLGEVELLGCPGLGLHLLVALQTRAVLGLACLGALAHPLELGAHLLGALGVLAALRLQAGGLLLEVRGVVALVRVELAAVNLADPAGNVVQEVAVVRDGHNGAGVVVQELLEPQDALGIQVVGGLVEKEQVRRLKQQAAQRHAASLAAGELGHRGVRVWALQGVHGLRELGVQIPAVCGVNLVLETAHLSHEGVKVRVGARHLLADLVEAVDLGNHVREGHLDVLAHGLVLVEGRLLLQEPHRIARRKARLAVGDVLEAGHDLEERRLAHAVGAHHTNLGTGIDAHRDVVEDDLLAHDLAGLVHLVHELCHCCSCLGRLMPVNGGAACCEKGSLRARIYPPFYGRACGRPHERRHEVPHPSTFMHNQTPLRAQNLRFRPCVHLFCY